MKAVLVPLLAVVSVSLAFSVQSPGEAADLVVSRLLSGDCDGKVVYAMPDLLAGGTLLDSWHESIQVPFDGWMVLVDDMALANWEHPCRWVFVASDGTMEILKMQVPPMGLPRMTVEYTTLPEDNGEASRLQFIDWFTPNPQPLTADPQHLYAWIISGGANQGNNHIRYYGDCQFIYMTLQDDYGYLDDHIIVCFADGTNPAPDNSSGGNSDPDFDDDGDTDITYDATLAGVTNGYNDIVSMVGTGDYLFIFTTDHGGSGKYVDLPPEVYLNLWNMQSLDDDVFDGWLDTFGSDATHVIMEQCYSGGFMAEVCPTTGGQPRTFGSAANGYESSWAGATYPEYDEWCYWWTGAMHGSTPPGGSYPGGPVPYDPDINGDSYVDFGEAFDAAFAWDSYAQSGQEHPQYDDDPDSCGSSYYLGGIIPVGIEDYNGPIAPGFGLSISGNPLNGSAYVTFSLPQTGNVELSVFDLSGRSVSTLASGEFQAGTHTVAWDVESAPAGVYVVRLASDGAFETARAVKF